MTDLTPRPDDPAVDVLALPGVASLFPVRVVSHVRETIAAVVSVGSEPVDRIEVTTVSGITRIRARISATTGSPAPATGRAVADALLRRASDPDDVVVVQIAHIAEPSTPFR